MRPANVIGGFFGALGAAVMGIAAWGILRDHAFTNPPGLARWLVGGVISHDFMLAPLSLLVGALVVRVVPQAIRIVVAYGLFVGGLVLLIGLPVLLASRRERANPTILQQNYVTGIVVAELVVLACTAIAAVVMLRRQKPTNQAVAKG